MRGVTVVRLQTIGERAILIVSQEWLYVHESEDKLILTKNPKDPRIKKER